MDNPEDRKRHELLAHINSLLEEKKREIIDYYAEVKLRVPSYLKNVPIDHLREAGATVDHDLVIPVATDNYFRKLARLRERLTELRDAQINQVKKHYDTIEKAMPKSLLEKKVSDLTENDWNTLGIDMEGFKKSLKRVNSR